MLPRTNNSVEGFHNGLRASVTSVHPNIWKFCSAIAAEETLVQTKITHIKRGDKSNKKTKYQVISARLKTLVQAYQRGDALNFLKQIAHNLH